MKALIEVALMGLILLTGIVVTTLAIIGYFRVRHIRIPGFNIFTGRWSDEPEVARDPVIAEGQRLKVLGILAHVGRDGATDAELADSLRTSLQNEKAHRCELVKRGYVEDSGQRRTWAWGSDAAGALWRITDQGRAELSERLRQPHETGAEEGGTRRPEQKDPQRRGGP